jgi:ABC-type anion transport system duplicated permease subunit
VSANSHNRSFGHQAGEVPIVSSNFLRSLFLAALFSFFAPLLLVSGSLASTWVLTCIPGLEFIGQVPANMLLDFLGAFGSGCAFQGMLTIGLACGFVGALFDIYVFYNFRTQKGS